MDNNILIKSQPDDLTCGPTCLHSVYKNHGESIGLDQVIAQVEMLEDGGTLASHLGIHALEAGYNSTIYTMNINIFDPTWFAKGQAVNLKDKLQKQMEFKADNRKLVTASQSYLRFMDCGGKVVFTEFNRDFLLDLLRLERPIIAGLSATYLYNCSREDPLSCAYDDIGGEPSGHFVVLAGLREQETKVRISDPFEGNPFFQNPYYDIDLDHLMCAILLGVVTYDANLLLIDKR